MQTHRRGSVKFFDFFQILFGSFIFLLYLCIRIIIKKVNNFRRRLVREDWSAFCGMMTSHGQTDRNRYYRMMWLISEIQSYDVSGRCTARKMRVLLSGIFICHFFLIHAHQKIGGFDFIFVYLRCFLAFSALITIFISIFAHEEG